MAMPPKVNYSNQTFFGVVSNFNEEKGWGFVDCEATKAIFNKDVFLSRTALSGHAVEPGTLVSFKVEVGMKGPQATSLSLLPPGSISNGGLGQTFQGTIKLFHEDKGWGFIEGEAVRQIFGKDIFIHKRELRDQVPQQGDEVTFTVGMDNNGQPQAKNVSVGTGQLRPFSARPARPAPY